MICIVAVDRNWSIGKDGRLLVHIPRDLQYFKERTYGKTVIMGRKTLESLPKKEPLKGRKNIVLNLGGDPIPEVICANSFDEAYAAAEGAEKCFIMGGASVYKAAINDMDTLYITHVHTTIEDADAFFPVIDMGIWEEASISETQVDPGTGYQFKFVVYKRRWRNENSLEAGSQ